MPFIHTNAKNVDRIVIGVQSKSQLNEISKNISSKYPEFPKNLSVTDTDLITLLIGNINDQPSYSGSHGLNRLPGKVLIRIGGLPIIEIIYNRLKKCQGR